MKEDVLTIEILDDGTVKISSPGSISGANHSNAEEAFKYIAAQLGGVNKRERIKGKHAHTHTHTDGTTHHHN